MSIKDIVKNTIAEFEYYADGSLWYIVKYDFKTNNTDGVICEDWKEFKFPIPIEDTKGAFFNRTHKAITLMRWIRKHLDVIESAKN